VTDRDHAAGDRSEYRGWPDDEAPAGARVFAHNERIVPASPAVAWDWLVHAQGWSDYYANAQFVDLAGGPREHELRRGSVFRWVTFGLPVVSVVDECVAPGTIGWRWHARRFPRAAHGYHIWILEPHEYGTRIVTEETQRGPLPMLLRPLLRRVLPLGHAYWLRQLARRAARGPAPEPEGRRPA
jgi:hypothetical protein